MDPVSATPTENADYAAVAVTYAALAGGVTLLAARRPDDAVPEDLGELLLYGAATAGLTRVLAKDKVASFVRAPFVAEEPDGDRHPRGRRLRYAVGELLGCTRCLGSWSALGLVGLRAVAPLQARVLATLLALSTANTLLQASMTGVQARASREEELAAAAADVAAGHSADALRDEALRTG